jgi:uncharacterized Zn finger protein
MSDWDGENFGWDYYSESRPRKVKDGIKVKSERGAIGTTWWSRRWVRALEGLGMGSRLTRGRSYARQGQVVSIDIEQGHVLSQVQGSLRKPYDVEIKLRPFNARQWDAITDAMSAQALFAAKLLAGEMPTNIEEAFAVAHISLFPTEQADLQTSCSCPDWANPCKHVAAVYYILADRFDEDPFLLFKLRGHTKEQIIEELRRKRVSDIDTQASEATPDQVPQTPQGDDTMHLEDYLATFWQASEGLDTVRRQASTPQDGQMETVDKAVLKRLGEAPASIGGKSITAWLAHVYDSVSASTGSVERDEEHEHSGRDAE